MLNSCRLNRITMKVRTYSLNQKLFLFAVLFHAMRLANAANLPEYDTTVLSALSQPAKFVAASQKSNRQNTLTLLSSEQGQPVASLPVESSFRDPILPVKVNNRWLLISNNSAHDNDWHRQGMLLRNTRVIDLSTGKWPRLGLDKHRKMNSDLTRIIEIRKSELWRAEFDWGSGTLINEEKVGAWGPLAKMTPIAWAGNLLYLKNPTNPDRPTIRISLDDGSFTELKLDISQRETIFSPSGRYAVLVRDELVYVLDLIRGETSTLSNRFAYKHPLGIEAAKWNSQEIIKSAFLEQGNGWEGKSLWYDEHTLITPSYLGGIAIVDVRKSNIEIDFLSQNPFDYFYRVLSHNATGRVAGSCIMRVGDRVLMSPMRGLIDKPFLYDIKSKSATPLSQSQDNGYWPARIIDDHRYLYEVTKGSLNDVGTWMHDLNSNQKIRLTSYGLGTAIGFHPTANLAYFKTDNGTVESISLNDSSYLIQPWMAGTEHIVSIHSPISIEVDSKNRSIWSPPNTLQVLPNQDTQKMSPLLIDSLKFQMQIAKVDNSKQSLVQEIMAYYSDYKLRFHDRHILLKEGIKVIARGGDQISATSRRKEPGGDPIQNVQTWIDYRTAFSREKFLGHVFDEEFKIQAKKHSDWQAMPTTQKRQILENCQNKANQTLNAHLKKGLSQSYISASNL